ncbi:MAG: hypothetical protein AB1817_00325 [Chloroflexota bacterium]
MTDPIGVWVGAILTLLVFSYLLGDTPLFRLAQAIFVGVTIGYAATAAVYLVLLPLLFDQLFFNPVLIVPLVLGLLLLTKLRASWASVGNISIAFLFGVGGALALGGALGGTLLPQLAATIVPLDSLENILLVLGTIGALLSFRFMRPQQPRVATRALETVGRGWGYVGRWFILVAFGALFAGTASSRVSILVNRVYFLLHDWIQVVR